MFNLGLKHAAKAIGNEALRLRFLNLATHQVDNSINERASIAAQLAENALPDGSVWIQCWERDCDGVQMADTYRIKASLLSYYAEYQRIAERAEGPFQVWIRPSEGKRFSRGQGWGII